MVDRCNQRCHFCNVDESSPGHAKDLATVRRRVRAAVAADMRVVVFSGGEPTLSDELADAIAISRDEGAELVMLQTNAVLLDQAPRAQSLAKAGLGLAF